MGSIALKVAGDKVAGDDAASAAVNNDELHHFVALVEFHTAAGYLAAEGTIGTE